MKMGRNVKIISVLFVSLMAGASAAPAQTNLPWCLELQRGATVECVYKTLDAAWRRWTVHSESRAVAIPILGLP
jgi:hypothetical protein